MDLPAPNETGAIPMVLRGPAQAGDCEVRITAMQGAATATRTLAYHIAAQ